MYSLNSSRKTGIDAFREAWLKRRAQYSTVAFLKTTDPKRLPQFITFIDSIYKNANKPYAIYLYKVWRLYKVQVQGQKIIFDPVNPVAVQQSSPLAAMASQLIQEPIIPLNTAVNYIESLMRTSETRIIFIIWGFFRHEANANELLVLEKFLRSVIFDETYYSKYHFVVIFSDAPETLVTEETLKHSIVVDVPPSTFEERLEILRKIATELGINIHENELKALADAMRGLTLHEVESVALESVFRHGTFKMDAMTAYKYDIIRKTGILDVEEPSHGFEAVGGYDLLKQFILNNVVKVLRNPEKAKRLGLEPPRGILLFGPPGTGKTWFARALAKELGLPFLWLRAEKIFSKWYGETTRNLAKALELAEAVAPCVLFIDEIDRFGRRGHPSEHEESRRAFSVFLEWLGDARRKTIVVGTTNRPEDLDEAFRRVGRFDYIIPVLYPDFKARVEILKVHTSVVRKVPLAEDVDLEAIAARTELWSGAELEELVKRAARMALREDSDVVKMEHFEKALATFRINIDERRRQLQHYLELAQQFTNDAEFLQQLVQQYKVGESARIEALTRF